MYDEAAMQVVPHDEASCFEGGPDVAGGGC